MVSINRKSYDVIIIGAGMSGLICGGYLSKAGLKVLIVEQHNKPGGYFTSFKRGGYAFDAAAHSFGNYGEGGYVRRVFSELGVPKILKIKRADPSNIVITPDFRIALKNNTEDTIAQLNSIFPEEKDGIIAFFTFVNSRNPIPFLKLKDQNFSVLLRSFFKNEKLISAIATPVFGNGGLPPSQMDAVVASKVFSESILDGGYYVEGGIQNLPNALEYIFKKNKGTILYKKRVKKIIIQENRATGIQLENDEVLTSRYIVSACDMKQTFKNFLGEPIVDDQTCLKLDSLVPSLSFFLLYIGLKKQFRKLPPGTNLWYLSNYDLDSIYRNILEAKSRQFDMFLVRVSPDGETLLASVLSSFKPASYWRKHKKIFTQKFIDRIDESIPNFKKNILYEEAATPYTLYRYTQNTEGAAFGWAKMSSQIFDPMLSRKSIIQGLYMTGHWTGVPYGMPGCCYSGYETMKRVLRNEKKVDPELHAC